MNTMHLALFGILIGSALIQFYLVAGFVFCLKNWKKPLLADEDSPPATVILCLRGGDPFLSRCIDGLLAQDYPDYDVLFMVDHAEDPSMPILKRALEGSNFDRFRIDVLTNPMSTCSLKCSSLVQAIEGLPSSMEMVAFLDADTIPHKTWLRELCTALAPKDVGAATGNRWYCPTQTSRGSLIRYLWNAAAIVQMYWYRIAWGGTLAMKLDSIRRAGVLDRWRRASAEDSMVHSALGNIGQKVVFVPSLMMINREDCSLSTYQSWVKRQLLFARLYHPFWPLVVAHGIGSAIVLLWGLWLCMVAALQGHIVGAAVLFFALFAFHAFLTSLLPWMERAVFDIAKGRGENDTWPNRPNWLNVLWLGFLTQWYYTWALVGCMLLTRFRWRGIDYEVSGPFDIKMLGYRPYQPEPESQEAQSI
jgi:glycosyltransferase involved in cell wall biosynthesis